MVRIIVGCLHSGTSRAVRLYPKNLASHINSSRLSYFDQIPFLKSRSINFTMNPQVLPHVSLYGSEL